MISVKVSPKTLATLIIISVHPAESLSEEMMGWADQWLKRKDRRAVVLLALFDPVARGPSSSVAAYLQEVAKRGSMEFVAQSQETLEDP